MALPLIMGKSTPKLTLSRLRPVSVAGDMKLRVGDELVPPHKTRKTDLKQHLELTISSKIGIDHSSLVAVR